MAGNEGRKHDKVEQHGEGDDDEHGRVETGECIDGEERDGLCGFLPYEQVDDLSLEDECYSDSTWFVSSDTRQSSRKLTVH